jgi:hypothetical protein
VALTEAEWLSCVKLTPMMNWLQRRGTDRQFYLAACAAVRHHDAALRRRFYRDVLDVVERYADGLADKAELRRAHRESAADADDEFLALAESDRKRLTPASRSVAASHAAAHASMPAGGWQAAFSAMQSATRIGKRAEIWAWQCALLRDIFGNPYRRVFLDPRWLSQQAATVGQLADAIYTERAFERLPILADALEEAGCSAVSLLEHCRGPGPHVRGCWVVDLLLGKH